MHGRTQTDNGSQKKKKKKNILNLIYSVHRAGRTAEPNKLNSVFFFFFFFLVCVCLFVFLSSRENEMVRHLLHNCSYIYCNVHVSNMFFIQVFLIFQIYLTKSNFKTINIFQNNKKITCAWSHVKWRKLRNLRWALNYRLLAFYAWRFFYSSYLSRNKAFSQTVYRLINILSDKVLIWNHKISI